MKKVGNTSIKEYLAENVEIDYDTIMGYYQDLIKKEREAFDQEKQRRYKELNLWVRALKEEEKVAIEKYCKEKGEEEMS